jgi:outer membrane biosynthesis protein TonB
MTGRGAVSGPRGADELNSKNVAARVLTFGPTVGSPQRLPLALIASVGAHAILIAAFGLYIKLSNIPLPDRNVLEITVIDMRGGRSKDSGSASAASAMATTPATHSTLVHPAWASKPNSSHHVHKTAKPTARRALPSLHVTKAETPRSKDSSKPSDSDKTMAPAPLTGSSSSKVAGFGLGTKTGTGNDSGSSTGPGTGSGAGFGNGGDTPRAIYAPVPSIPDDMRDQLMQATATARFRVSRDGTATVVLISATDFSELNDIILDTLRKWRFIPAMKNGIAVDSQADVRLLISVR